MSALRLLQGEPCPQRRAEATRERRERMAAADPHDLHFWLREATLGDLSERQRQGARWLLERLSQSRSRELEATTVDGMPIAELLELGCALERAPQVEKAGG